jgi:hypothetical protein
MLIMQLVAVKAPTSRGPGGRHIGREREIAVVNPRRQVSPPVEYRWANRSSKPS